MLSFVKKFFVSEASESCLHLLSKSSKELVVVVLRKIDAFPYPHLERLLAQLIRVMIESEKREQ